MKTYRISNILIITALYLFATSCVKEKVTPRDWPIVETLQTTEINSSGALLKANITYNDGFEIIDHGFIWGSKTDVSYYSLSDIISLGSFGYTGEFSGMATRSMGVGMEVFYRAYIVTDSYTVTGNTMSFISKGSDPPVVTDYTPHTASIFDTIVISGENFSKLNTVYFGDAPAITISESANKIKAVVPNTISSVNARISLECRGHDVNLTPNFTFLLPEIDSYSPASARIGEDITISGSNFPKVNGEEIIQVYVGSVSAALQSITDSELIIKVPNRIESASEPIRVVSTLLDETFIDNFSLEAPLITSLSKTTGTIGEQVTIYGEGFHYYLLNNVVLLGGQPVNATSATGTLISLRIPSGFSLPTGDYKFSVTLFGLTVESAEDFHYVAPAR